MKEVRNALLKFLQKMLNGYKRYGIRWLSALVPVILLSGMAEGCAGQVKEASEGSRAEEVTIPIILTVDPSTGKKKEQDLVEAFNKAYKGTYQAEVEWVVETEEEYRQNLKRLNVTDRLPAVITDLRMLPSFYQMMIQDGRIEDLSSYIMQDAEWREMIEPVVLEGCREPDGQIYLAPLSTAAFSCSGIFWNQELFDEAGIASFPETWEEFYDCCETLKNQGIIPLALHTEGTAWAPMLLSTAELADSAEGEAFMNEVYPESYQNKNGMQLAKTLQRLFVYSSEDAMHNDFDVSYTNFFSGNAAMLPNGYWMIEQIPEEWNDKVRFSPFPGNKLVSSPETFGWSVVSGYSKDIKAGAIEFLKFRTKLNQEEKENLFAKDTRFERQAEQDYIQAYKNQPQIVPNYQVKWNSILQEETLGEYLPELAAGKITPKEFTQRLDESVRQFEEER